MLNDQYRCFTFSPVHVIDRVRMSQTEQLVAGLCELWQEGLLCDVKLQVEQKTFSVHRAVLAASSPYWKAMFTGNFKESTDKIVQVKDMSSGALEEIISYIYTTKLNITAENVMDIFSAAHITQMVFIQEQCKEWMLGNMKPLRCITYLAFAQKYEIEELRNAADTFIKENFTAVMKGAKNVFNTISQKELCHYLSSDELRNNYNEMIVYQAAKDWIIARDVKDEKDIGEIMGNVRFALIEPNKLSNIMYEDFITSHTKCQDMVKEAMKYHININSQPFYEGVMNKPRGEFGLFIIPNGAQKVEYDHAWYDVIGEGEAPTLRSMKGKHNPEHISPIGMPVVYESMSSVAIGNFLFVFGVDNSSYQNFTKRYDASTNMWHDLKPVPRVPTIGTCAVRRENEIFLIGGYPVREWSFITGRGGLGN